MICTTIGVRGQDTGGLIELVGIGCGSRHRKRLHRIMSLHRNMRRCQRCWLSAPDLLERGPSRPMPRRKSEDKRSRREENETLRNSVGVSQSHNWRNRHRAPGITHAQQPRRTKHRDSIGFARSKFRCENLSFLSVIQGVTVRSPADITHVVRRPTAIGRRNRDVLRARTINDTVRPLRKPYRTRDAGELQTCRSAPRYVDNRGLDVAIRSARPNGQRASVRRKIWFERAASRTQ